MESMQLLMTQKYKNLLIKLKKMKLKLDLLIQNRLKAGNGIMIKSNLY